MNDINPGNILGQHQAPQVSTELDLSPKRLEPAQDICKFDSINDPSLSSNDLAYKLKNTTEMATHSPSSSLTAVEEERSESSKTVTMDSSQNIQQNESLLDLSTLSRRKVQLVESPEGKGFLPFQAKTSDPKPPQPTYEGFTRCKKREELNPLKVPLPSKSPTVASEPQVNLNDLLKSLNLPKTEDSSYQEQLTNIPKPGEWGALDILLRNYALFILLKKGLSTNEDPTEAINQAKEIKPQSGAESLLSKRSLKFEDCNDRASNIKEEQHEILVQVKEEFEEQSSSMAQAKNKSKNNFESVPGPSKKKIFLILKDQPGNTLAKYIDFPEEKCDKPVKSKQNPEKNLPVLVLRRAGIACIDYIDKKRTNDLQYLTGVLGELSDKKKEQLKFYIKSFKGMGKTWTVAREFLHSDKKLGGILLKAITGLLSEEGAVDFEDWIGQTNHHMKDNTRATLRERKKDICAGFKDIEKRLLDPTLGGEGLQRRPEDLCYRKKLAHGGLQGW